MIKRILSILSDEIYFNGQNNLVRVYLDSGERLVVEFKTRLFKYSSYQLDGYEVFLHSKYFYLAYKNILNINPNMISFTHENAYTYNTFVSMYNEFGVSNSKRDTIISNELRKWNNN